MSDTSDAVSRRDFARRAAAAAVAGSLLTDVPAAAALPDDTDAEAAKLRPAHELLTDWIRQRFPHEKLNEATIDLIRADIAGDLGRSGALDQFPLKNSDEPGFVFSAWRSDGAK